ncbi:hypothetical protein, partial [Prevotella sp. kh1p2]|uniref:hypothetical protein n=1 Tax=Prevotella sp. kh1p2 TaxID=1761883 RepID=UPI001C432648
KGRLGGDDVQQPWIMPGQVSSPPPPPLSKGRIPACFAAVIILLVTTYWQKYGKQFLPLERGG